MPRIGLLQRQLHLADSAGGARFSNSSGLAQPYTGGSTRYYPETFSAGFTASVLQTNPLGCFTCVGPLFTGGPRSWDRIGAFTVFATTPGTPPDYYFVVYILDNETLLPTELIYQSPVALNPGVAVTWAEDTIALDTTADWLGIGWHQPDIPAGEGIGVRTFGISAGVADTYQGYGPYGSARSGDTLLTGWSTWAEQASGTTTAAPPGDFAFPPPVGSVPFRGSGVYMRRV